MQPQGTKIEKKVKLDKFEIVKYQLLHYCFIHKIKVNETELNCLALLGELGKIRLTEFALKVVEREILGNPATVSNCLAKIEKSLFCRTNGGKKFIYLNPALQIVSEGNVLIELKLYKIETNKSTGTVQKNSPALELTT